MEYLSNVQIAELFRKVAVAYQMLNENRFKIIAYERAADSIAQLTSDCYDLWRAKKLDDIPGVGKTIVGHLDELFRTGSMTHIQSVLSQIPPSVFPLLLIPGVGPKRAYQLVKELQLTNPETAIEDLEQAVTKHTVASLEGFGEKSEKDILQNIATYKRGAIKEKRILLSEADAIAQQLIAFLSLHKHIERVDVLGSLRRCVSTIGDIDIAIVTKNPKESIEYFCTYPHDELIEQGPTGASIRLHNGRQVDLRVQDKESYGAMLQYFTGSKNHNIALRSYALTKHLSLSEYGIKQVRHESSVRLRSGQAAENRQKEGKIKQFKSEKDFYEYLGMDLIPPELREGRGEVERALSHTLPNLVELKDMKGDLHLHTSYDLEPSHDLGANTLHELLDQAAILNYDYIGISDHNPSVGNHTDSEIVSIMKKRQAYYKEQCRTWNARNKKDIQVFVMLEVDIKPDGTLALPIQAFDFVDAVIVSVHSSFTLDRDVMTQRIITALTAHPKVKVFGHPTGRLINRRESYEAHWDQIFDTVKKHDIALEINASPYRLDLSDALVYEALKKKCTFVIDTDAHQSADMNGMKYGVSVARRGWAEKRDILNTNSYNDIKKWLM